MSLAGTAADRVHRQLRLAGRGLLPARGAPLWTVVLPTAGYDTVDGDPTHGAQYNAPPNTPFYSDLTYTLKQYAAFGEATWHFTDHWAATAGLRYYNFKEERTLLFGGCFVGTPIDGG